MRELQLEALVGTLADFAAELAEYDDLNNATLIQTSCGTSLDHRGGRQVRCCDSPIENLGKIDTVSLRLGSPPPANPAGRPLGIDTHNRCGIVSDGARLRPKSRVT